MSAAEDSPAKSGEQSNLQSGQLSADELRQDSVRAICFRAYSDRLPESSPDRKTRLILTW